jgi:hypothetical protein
MCDLSHHIGETTMANTINTKSFEKHSSANQLNSDVQDAAVKYVVKNPGATVKDFKAELDKDLKADHSIDAKKRQLIEAQANKVLPNDNETLGNAIEI